MTYGLISIDLGSVNLGNRLIEYAIKRLLNLGEPDVVVSMFSTPTNEQIERLNQVDLVLIPGSTTLALDFNQSGALVCLSKIKPPVFCCGSSGWAPGFPYYTEAMKYIEQPLGVRDPHTQEVCDRTGIDSTLIGCPTMFLPKQGIEWGKFTIVGFARDGWNWQKKVFDKLEGRIVASLQEPPSEHGFASKITDVAFDYKDPRLVMDHYAKCSAICTGRLHSVLPALSQEKPVCFFGHRGDSRFSLLEHLGIMVNPIDGDTNLNFIGPDIYADAVRTLWENFLAWKAAVGL